jgi:Uma2 family endonuclease
LGSKALTPAPEICVEILSPSNTQEEIDEKRDAYLRAGAKEVWLCDRDNRMTFFADSGQLKRSQLCPDFPLELDLSQRPINKLQEQLLGVLPTVVSPGAIWPQVEPGLGPCLRFKYSATPMAETLETGHEFPPL